MIFSIEKISIEMILQVQWVTSNVIKSNFTSLFFTF